MPERLREGGIVLVPALAAVALLVWWTADEGGYLLTTWGPSSLVVLGLLAATVVGIGFDRLRLTRAGAIALGALTAYTAWSYLSIAWSASPGDALDGSNRTLLYLLAFALFALLPWREWTALAALTVFALALGVIAVVLLARLGSADAVPSMFNGGRLETPLGYVNATAAAFFVGTALSIALAARRELPAVVRGLLLAGATAGLFVSILAESRGWLFALPIVLAVAVALIPGRLRLSLWTLPVAVLGAAALRPLLDVFERRDEAGLESPEAARQALIDAAAHAGSVALPLVAVALAVGVGLALLDRRVAVPAQVSRRAGRAAAALTALALLGAVVVGFAATDGRPDRKIADYWDRSQGYEQAEVGSSRFGSVGSNRPDFWKVSLSAFADRPIGGLGQDNWGDYYLRERDSTEQPRWTHSLQLRLLAHTGAVGFLLIAAFLAAVVAAALRGRGGRGRSPVASPSPLAQALAAIALLPLVVWFVHGSIDWFWEVPALSGSAFAFAGLATALSSGPAPARSAPEATGEAPGAAARRSWRPLLAVAAGGVGLLAALALALPWLAERDTIAAAQSWHEDPAGALSRLNRAADLNPLSARADLTAGVIALELNGPELAKLRFDRAIERDPDDWFGHFGRGLAESALGDAAAARADYVEARRLSPHDPLVREALRRVDGRRPLSAATAFARLREHVDELTG